MADLLASANANNAPSASNALIPSGASFSCIDGRIALASRKGRAVLYWVAYGYIGEIKAPSKEERDSIGPIPFNSIGPCIFWRRQCGFVADYRELPFRYGSFRGK